MAISASTAGRWHHTLRASRTTAMLMASLAFVNLARAEEDSLERDARICSAWDVHISTLIEDFGRLNIVGPSDLADAAFQQIQARVLCDSGRVKDAVEVYERIGFPLCAEEDCADAIRRE